MEAKLDDNQKKVEAFQEKINANQAVMRSTIGGIEEKMEAIQEEAEARMAKLKAKMGASIANRKNDRKEMSCQETTEERLECEETASGNMKDAREKTSACIKATEKIEQDPRTIQCMEEHQDVPSEDVIVRPVNGLRKRRRVQKLTAGRRREPKELTRGYCGSWRRVTVAGKRTSRHAAVVWRKRKLFRRSETQEHCGSQRLFAAASRGMALCGGVARCGGHDGKRYDQVNVGQEIKKLRKDEKRLRKRPECNSGLRNAFLRQQLQDPDKSRQLRHNTTGLTPASLVFGRELRLPCDLLFGMRPDKDKPTTDYAAGLVDHLHDIHTVCPPTPEAGQRPHEN
jgi:hypothetical protein